MLTIPAVACRLEVVSDGGFQQLMNCLAWWTHQSAEALNYLLATRSPSQGEPIGRSLLTTISLKKLRVFSVSILQPGKYRSLQRREIAMPGVFAENKILG